MALSTCPYHFPSTAETQIGSKWKFFAKFIRKVKLSKIVFIASVEVTVYQVIGYQCRKSD
jgi:hypothetical protein